MTYRSSPLENGVFSWVVDGSETAHYGAFFAIMAPKQPDVERVRQKEAHARAQSKDTFDLRNRVVVPPSLSPGDRFHVRDLNRDAEVVSSSPAKPRSVVVKSTKYAPLKRNVTNLVPLQTTELSDDNNVTKKSSFGRIIKPRQILDL